MKFKIETPQINDLSNYGIDVVAELEKILARELNKSIRSNWYCQRLKEIKKSIKVWRSVN